ncbi:MAG TPA: hypothetical protein PKM88_14195, partial [bacterium]|nr:hypothetical protein [bacterium]
MLDRYRTALCCGIDKVAHQDNARSSLHALLGAVSKLTGADVAYVAVKDRASDMLKILNQVGLSETARREFNRGVGSGAIGR